MKEMNNLISGRNVGEIMSEALFPEDVDFFGIGVSPSFYSALIVTAVLLLFALAVRIFAIPRFKKVPGKFQLLIETLVKFFDNLAKGNSPDHNGFLGTYIFSAGLLVFFGTIIEMFGFRAVMGDYRRSSDKRTYLRRVFRYVKNSYSTCFRKRYVYDDARSCSDLYTDVAYFYVLRRSYRK